MPGPTDMMSCCSSVRRLVRVQSLVISAVADSGPPGGLFIWRCRLLEGRAIR